MERARGFVRLWTLKEAYVKAVGRGIGARPGLQGFSVSLDHTDAGEECLHLPFYSAYTAAGGPMAGKPA